eukprot:TRINITY_DN985_c0_g2_i1.p1 TRINITY_DN985_c0_g2~~TRINITY_DN985_c0_g2_i1.p1  ORF type:complete len:260 (+),score=93.47 TRINITY_DN985_c0_g2_i1:42-821(+)
MRHGYWGPVTASVDWCEDNYVVSFYIAEFVNTCSSFPMVALSLYALWWGSALNRRDKYFVAACATSACVGAGSMLFHGTLRHEGQVLDEVPMLIGICSFILLLRMTDKQTNPVVPYVLAGWCLLACAIYASSNFHIFCVMYFLSVLYTIYVSRQRLAACRNTRIKAIMQKFINVGALGYLLGSVLFWVPEMLLCGNRLETSHETVVKHLHMHAVFHLASGVSIYCFLCFAVLLHADMKDREAALVFEIPSQVVPKVLIV